jgi:hypothetical protein
MLSIGLPGWYINVIVTIVDIIHRPVFYFKHMMDNIPTSQETLHLRYELNSLMISIG